MIGDCESAACKNKIRVSRYVPVILIPRRGVEKSDEERIQSFPTYGSVVKLMGITCRKSFKRELVLLGCLIDTINMS